MLCEHGNISPCVECDIEPLRVENEKLREALEAIVSHHDEYFGDSSAESKMPWIKQARSALATHRKQQETRHDN